MSQAEAIAFALGESPSSASPAGSLHDQGRPHLTDREQEVAALITRGMSNGEIAAALVISARTVETHVQHIMNKLGCGTRAQIAAWVASGPALPPLSAGNR
jgi:DNA-binding NarL/FixJ family response regulator